MNRIIIASALALCVGVSSWAQSFTPSPGALNKEENTKGLNAVTLNVPSGTIINREAKGYIELIRNGELLMQIPAQNSQRIYMYEGYSSHLKASASAMIAFFMDAKSTEGMIEGTYEVKVPEGFFMLRGTTPNAALTATYQVPAYTAEEMGIAQGEKVTMLNTVDITLPEGATNVKYTDTSYSEQRKVTDPYSGETEIAIDHYYAITVNCAKYGIYEKVSGVTVNGNVITLTMPNVYTAPGQYTIEFLSGCITYDLNGESHNYTTPLTYNVTGNTSGYEITPANGSTIIGDIEAKPFDFMKTVYVDGQSTQVKTTGYYYFAIDVPVEEGGTVAAFMGAPTIYKANPDGTVGDKVQCFGNLVMDLENNTRAYVANNFTTRENNVPLTLAPGDYILRIPQNALRINGQMNPQIDFNYTIEADPAATKQYTVTPSSGDLHELTTITLTYPEGSELSWKNAGWATLSNGTATYAFTYHNITTNPLTEYYESITLEGNKVIFHISNPIRENGEWSLSIPMGSLLVNGQDSPSVETWNVTAASEISLSDITTRMIPAGEDVTLADTYYSMGMGIIQWGINASGVMINRQCKDKVKMLFNGVQIAELDPANEEEVTTFGTGQAAEGDDTVIGISDLVLIFSLSYGDELYTKEGVYTVVVPDGLLLNYTTPVKGGEISYNYSSGTTTDFSYTLNPANGSTLTTAEDLRAISITFTNARSIEDIPSTSAYLYAPDGSRVKGKTSLSTIEGKTITWKFEDGKTPIVWTNGTYKFVIPENTIAVDMTYFDGETGNFPGLEAFFTLMDDSLTGVNGIEAENSFTIFGIDGTVLVENGSEADVKALAPGLYIINGKKFIVK